MVADTWVELGNKYQGYSCRWRGTWLSRGNFVGKGKETAHSDSIPAAEVAHCFGSTHLDTLLMEAWLSRGGLQKAFCFSSNIGLQCQRTAPSTSTSRGTGPQLISSAPAEHHPSLDWHSGTATDSTSLSLK